MKSSRDAQPKYLAGLRRRQIEFVVRRAFRSADRSCSRADVIEAFGLGPSAASAVIASTRQAFAELVLARHKINAPLFATTPSVADETDLLEALESGRDQFAETGLRPEELPVKRVVWRTNLPVKPGAFSEIVRAIVGSKSIWIRYTTLNMGVQATWKKVMPIRLEEVNAHWRVAAHDLDREDRALRTYALSRILDVKPIPSKLPKGFVAENPHDSEVVLQVELDSRLTQDQREAMQTEFAIEGGRVTVPHRSVHEFVRQFVRGADADSQAIWPPFVSADVVR